MRTTKLFIVLLLLFHFSNAAEKTDEDTEFLLSLHKAGQLTIGMGVDDVFKAYGRDNVKLVDLNLEGSFTPALEIYIKGVDQKKASIQAMIACKERMVIWYASVFDRRFKTDKGIGINSTLADIKEIYTITYGFIGEGTVGVYIFELQMAFELGIDLMDLPPEYIKSNDYNLIPDTTRVNAIGVGWWGF